jgi:hypothetical protein
MCPAQHPGVALAVEQVADDPDVFEDVAGRTAHAGPAAAPVRQRELDRSQTRIRARPN